MIYLEKLPKDFYKCGNYDGDEEEVEYDPQEDLDMMFPDEDDQAELHDGDW